MAPPGAQHRYTPNYNYHFRLRLATLPRILGASWQPALATGKCSAPTGQRRPRRWRRRRSSTAVVLVGGSPYMAARASGGEVPRPAPTAPTPRDRLCLKALPPARPLHRSACESQFPVSFGVRAGAKMLCSKKGTLGGLELLGVMHIRRAVLRCEQERDPRMRRM